MTRLYQTTQLDNLEIFYVDNYQQGFPLHFHDTYCLSLILSGTECTALPDRSLLALPGSLSITHPGEVHANPLPEHNRQSFVTLYISPDVVRSLNGGGLARFAPSVIHDAFLFDEFQRFTDLLLPPSTTCSDTDEDVFRRLLRQLIVHHAHPFLPENTTSAPWFASLDSLIDEQLHRKLTLDEMARQMGLSKFKFARWFKDARGISPAHYLVVKRVERAKDLLRRGNSLADTTFQVGFYDQAHFSRAFQRVTGLTPGSYRQAVE